MSGTTSCVHTDMRQNELGSSLVDLELLIKDYSFWRAITILLRMTITKSIHWLEHVLALRPCGRPCRLRLQIVLESSTSTITTIKESLGPAAWTQSSGPD